MWGVAITNLMTQTPPPVEDVKVKRQPSFTIKDYPRTEKQRSASIRALEISHQLRRQEALERRKVLQQYIKQNQPLKQKQMSDGLGWTKKTIEHLIEVMKKDGEVYMVTKGRGATWGVTDGRR